jgi:uncharacterized protein
MQIDQPLSDQDLDRLDEFLMSDDTPEETMMLDELHGFLTALMCSPEVVLPSQWMPLVWGGEEPEFETTDQAQDIMGLIMRLNNDISGDLHGDGEFGPLFTERTLEDGSTITMAQGWCEGFVRGMQLQPGAWRDEALNEALMPIVILSETLEDPKIEALLDDAEAVQTMADTVPDAVVRIHSYLRQQASTARTVRRSQPKVGRNDPCPCGSGKKYKKCCGAQTFH